MKVLLIEKPNDWQVEFGVGVVPNRKHQALVKFNGVETKVLAYFRDDECVKEFKDIMDAILYACNDLEVDDAVDSERITWWLRIK